jgi:hypothetical protein
MGIQYYFNVSMYRYAEENKLHEEIFIALIMQVEENITNERWRFNNSRRIRRNLNEETKYLCPKTLMPNEIAKKTNRIMEKIKKDNED